MAYKKFLVDNPTCSRRYHLTYNDQDKTVATTQVQCQQCGVIIFSAKNHPKVTLAREENLIKTSQLADLLVSDCAFEDSLSKRTIPGMQDQDCHVYPNHAVPVTRPGS
jgi:DNA-directed RNA polymerase subunit RPC12/RpoP